MTPVEKERLQRVVGLLKQSPPPPGPTFAYTLAELVIDQDAPATTRTERLLLIVEHIEETVRAARGEP